MPGVSYEISFTATGDGAKLAVADLKVIQASADGAYAALNRMGGPAAASLATVNTATKSAASTLKAMQGAAFLIGSQTFPQLTMATVTAQAAFHGLKSAAAATGGSFASVAAPLAVIAAGLYSVTRAGAEMLNMMAAVKTETESGANLDASLKAQAGRIHEALIKAVAEGRAQITDQQAETWELLLGHPTAAGLAALRREVSAQLPNLFMSDAERGRITGDKLSRQQLEFAYKQAKSDEGSQLHNFSEDEDRKRRIVLLQKQYNEAISLTGQLENAGMLTAQQAKDIRMQADTQHIRSMVQIRRELTDVQKLEQRVAEEFASDFTNAFMAFASGTKSAQAAMKEFAAQFMQDIARMILRAAALAAIQSIFGLGGGGGYAALFSRALGGAANGTVRFAADGLPGVAAVSSPTYFPKFNTVAGEAGREMLTVLAKPRMMEIGGMEAVVGNAGTNRLAITNADQLAQRGGASGSVNINVSMEPGLRAEIIDTSVQGAVVRVTQDMGRHTPLREAAKKASG